MTLRIQPDDTFARLHRVERQHAELKSLEREAEDAIDSALEMESKLMAEFVRRARAYVEMFVDLTATALPPLTVRLRPGAVSKGTFMVAMPIHSLLSLARHGFLSRMKHLLEDEPRSELHQSYQATLPAESLKSSLAFGAVAEGREPYLCIAATPQRVIRLMKGSEPFSFEALLVSDDTVSPRPRI